MTTSADFEKRWKAACVEVQGRERGPTGRTKQDSRMVRQSVVVKVVARGARGLEYTTPRCGRWPKGRPERPVNREKAE